FGAVTLASDHGERVAFEFVNSQEAFPCQSDVHPFWRLGRVHFVGAFDDLVPFENREFSVLEYEDRWPEIAGIALVVHQRQFPGVLNENGIILTLNAVFVSTFGIRALSVA